MTIALVLQILSEIRRWRNLVKKGNALPESSESPFLKNINWRKRTEDFSDYTVHLAAFY
jgi:hypothetical protein